MRGILRLAVAIILGVGSLAIAGGPAQAATYTPPAARTRVDLNSGWKFLRSDAAGAQATTFNDTSWQTVNTPHTWNAADGADGGNNYYRGIGWYRRHYSVPASFAGRQLYLQFAGVNQVADVWVNGVSLGQHRGGYARFRFNATAAFKVGQDNVIAVKVTNANNVDIPPLSADYTFDGGIYRNVSFYAVDPLQIRMLDYSGPGIYLRQRSVSATSATVDVTTKLFNNNTSARSYTVRTVVTDAAGTIVADQTRPAASIGATGSAEVVQTVAIANPHRWDGTRDPYLYHATVELGDGGRVTDVVTEPLGLHTIGIAANTGFTLNGHAWNLHGVDLHQDRAGVGWAQTDADHTQDFDIIDEIGATAVRMAHYQHDQKDYNLADERGQIVYAEIPLVNDTTASSGFTANAQQQMYELIRQNYNHPSVAIWGIGNEQRQDNAATNTLLASLENIVRAEDPDRISTYATCCVADTGAVPTHAETTSYNKYYGWYTGDMNGLGPNLDSLHSALPGRPIGVSEYGAGANPAQHEDNPAQPSTTGAWHPEEYQSRLHEAAWRQLSARPYVWGSFVWNLFDFASDGRNEGSTPGINDKGLLTRDRAIKKDAFYWYKVNWNPDPMLYLTSRRWTSRTTAATQVCLYSNAPTVNVTLNGVSLGVKSSTDHTFTWTGVTLRPGANTITATGTVNATTVSDSVVWTLN
ncbi:MAG: beta-galactosidase [Actinoplanes sp.]|nr:beta-galactosidase [Actinoplanes sp.]